MFTPTATWASARGVAAANNTAAAAAKARLVIVFMRKPSRKEVSSSTCGPETVLTGHRLVNLRFTPAISDVVCRFSVFLLVMVWNDLPFPTATLPCTGD